MKNTCYYEPNELVGKYISDVRRTSKKTKRTDINKLPQTNKIDELVTTNLRFVISIAKEYQGYGLPLPDLISEGNYGLIKAANRFDETRGFKFISYAVWWVRQSIIHSIKENAKIIRLPISVINKIHSMNKEIESTLYSEFNENVVEYEDYKNNNFVNTISLSTALNESSDELGDKIKAEEDVIKICGDVKDKLESMVNMLDERERKVIRLYYGGDGSEDTMTLEEIGKELSLTKERVRQIKNTAILKLRNNSIELQELMV